MPLAGQILHHKDFVFRDGEKGNKYIIALNSCDNDKTCLVVKTTKQSRHYPLAYPGCNSSKCIFLILKDCEQDFAIDTYVQLDHIYSVNVEEQLNNKQVTFTGHLTPICFTNLKRCLRNFRDDIPQRYWQIIYSK
ncbi:MAG: hypothetical protein A2Z69_00475 [Bacteroidetes bacterium RBG_13_44_24]|nr:MAG: hypothetical protein A2Z69_00475 [Bacteroidetes bacterium RBG_13_44_24]